MAPPKPSSRLSSRPGTRRRLTHSPLAKAASNDLQAAHEIVTAKIERHYRLRLQHWLSRLYPGMAELAATMHGTDPRVAAERLMVALTPNPTALSGLANELAALYVDAYAGGVARANRRGPSLGLWEPWRPLESDAQHVGGMGLDTLLRGAAALASELAQTQRDRAGEILAGTLKEGAGRDQLRWKIRHLQAAHAQAEMTAVTEATRGQVAGAVDSMRAAGVPTFDVLLDNEACPVCSAIAARNPHSVGGQTPPFHPRCRCSITPA